MQFLLASLACVLAACAGGSGSSGFDATASENAAINTALQEQRCVAHEALQICPVGTNTHAPAPQVNTSLDGVSSVDCAPATGSAPCSFRLPFMPEGFPSSTSYRIAVRNVNPIGLWHIGSQPLMSGAPGIPDFDAPVDAPSGAPAPDEHVQVAILAFLQPPRSVPTVVQDLSDSGADFAFVTNALTLLFNL